MITRVPNVGLKTFIVPKSLFSRIFVKFHRRLLQFQGCQRFIWGKGKQSPGILQRSNLQVHLSESLSAKIHCFCCFTALISFSHASEQEFELFGFISWRSSGSELLSKENLHQYFAEPYLKLRVYCIQPNQSGPQILLICWWYYDYARIACLHLCNQPCDSLWP